MNPDVEKAVELAEVRNEMRGDSGRYPNGEGWGHCYRVDGYWLPKDAWQTIRQALRDQEAEIANLERRRSHEHIVAENALTLLRECDAIARKRGDKYGLCDSIDNDGQPYQSAHLAAHLGGDHD